MFELRKSVNSGGHSDRYHKLKKSYRENLKQINYGDFLKKSENKNNAAWKLINGDKRLCDSYDSISEEKFNTHFVDQLQVSSLMQSNGSPNVISQHVRCS